jgi:cyclohexanone monooxygenase
MSEVATQPRHVEILIAGGGFSGLGAAIKLTQAGKRDFVVVERGPEVGGTWRDNTYPGAACDVPSHLYSYSFELNPNWTRSFSSGWEIQEYLRRIARKHHVLDKHIFDCEMLSANWDASAGQWVVETSKGAFTAKVLVCAIGALCEPSLPDINGIDEFSGEVVHSARWNHDYDMTGKRVALVGTGASAVQIGPEIAPLVERLDVYQRTAPWIVPRRDRTYPKAERLAYKHIPGLQRLARTLIYWGRETFVFGFAINPKFAAPARKMAEGNINRGIKDPALRKAVTPTFQIGCKRILLSNDWATRSSPPTASPARSTPSCWPPDSTSPIRRRSTRSRVPTAAPSARCGARTACRHTRARRCRASRTCSSWSGRTPASGTTRWC